MTDATSMVQVLWTYSFPSRYVQKYLQIAFHCPRLHHEATSIAHHWFHFDWVAKGFLKTRMTESPRKNILAMYLSLLTGFDFLPLPALGVSVHISLTFSNTILQWRSKAFTLPKSFLLFLQLMRTWLLFFTDCVSTDNGPVLNSSCSLWASSSGVSSRLWSC